MRIVARLALPRGQGKYRLGSCLAPYAPARLLLPLLVTSIALGRVFK